MPLENPNNCWPTNLQTFADAVANSAQFQTLTLTATAGAAAAFIFGKRLTHTRNGQAWTAEELKALLAYAMVYGDPGVPYGKHLEHNSVYRPHGSTIVVVGRLVPEANLQEPGDNRTGLNDEHDRQWQNIMGTIADQMVSWLQENGGPYPLSSFDVTDDSETAAENQPQQGCWQVCELTFDWGRES